MQSKSKTISHSELKQKKKTILKIIWNHKDLREPKTLSKNYGSERLPFQSHSNKTQTDTQTNATQLKTQV